jgi:hypothetical protein
MDRKPLQGDSGNNEDLHEDLDIRIQGIHFEIETRTPLETTWHEFETQLAEVETRAERGSCRRTGTSTGAVQPLKFNGSTSWAMF